MYIHYILFYTLRNILPEAICCCFVIGIVLCMYNIILSFLQLLILTSYLGRLPEAICCCFVCGVVDVFCIIVHKLSWSLVLTSVSYSLLLA